MPLSQRPLEQLSALADRLYAECVKPHLRPADDGKFVAVDLDTGDYELDADDYAAAARLRARRPHAEMWLLRVGFRAAYRMGRSV